MNACAGVGEATTRGAWTLVLLNFVRVLARLGRFVLDEEKFEIWERG